MVIYLICSVFHVFQQKFFFSDSPNFIQAYQEAQLQGYSLIFWWKKGLIIQKKAYLQLLEIMDGRNPDIQIVYPQIHKPKVTERFQQIETFQQTAFEQHLYFGAEFKYTPLSEIPSCLLMRVSDKIFDLTLLSHKLEKHCYQALGAYALDFSSPLSNGSLAEQSESISIGYILWVTPESLSDCINFLTDSNSSKRSVLLLNQTGPDLYRALASMTSAVSIWVIESTYMPENQALKNALRLLETEWVCCLDLNLYVLDQLEIYLNPHISQNYDYLSWNCITENFSGVYLEFLPDSAYAKTSAACRLWKRKYFLAELLQCELQEKNWIEAWINPPISLRQMQLPFWPVRKFLSSKTYNEFPLINVNKIDCELSCLLPLPQNEKALDSYLNDLAEWLAEAPETQLLIYTPAHTAENNIDLVEYLGSLQSFLYPQELFYLKIWSKLSRLCDTNFLICLHNPELIFRIPFPTLEEGVALFFQDQRWQCLEERTFLPQAVCIDLKRWKLHYLESSSFLQLISHDN